MGRTMLQYWLDQIKRIAGFGREEVQETQGGLQHPAEQERKAIEALVRVATEIEFHLISFWPDLRDQETSRLTASTTSLTETG